MKTKHDMRKRRHCLWPGISGLAWARGTDVQPACGALTLQCHYVELLLATIRLNQFEICESFWIYLSGRPLVEAGKPEVKP